MKAVERSAQLFNLGEDMEILKYDGPRSCATFMIYLIIIPLVISFEMGLSCIR